MFAQKFVYNKNEKKMYDLLKLLRKDNFGTIDWPYNLFMNLEKNIGYAWIFRKYSKYIIGKFLIGEY